MSWVSSAAIFFVIWWTVLFAVLPFGVRNASESGTAIEDGNDAGAPVAHGLRWKMAVTTVVSVAVFALVYLLLGDGLATFANLPFFRDAPKI
jgi:predicted secreted protein